MTANRRHRLSEQDRQNLVATCSVCGPGVKIMRKGKYGLACREGDREAKRRYRETHVERVRAGRKRPPSKHRLTKRDGSPDTCAICGPVQPVVIGRGWGCPKRAAELGWKTFAATPQPACRICRTYLDRFGNCPKCDDDMSDLEYSFAPVESRLVHRRAASAARWFDEYEESDGKRFSILEWETPLDHHYESVQPHPRVIGSPRPESEFKVRSEYAALYGSGRR